MKFVSLLALMFIGCASQNQATQARLDALEQREQTLSDNLRHSEVEMNNIHHEQAPDKLSGLDSIRWKAITGNGFNTHGLCEVWISGSTPDQVKTVFLICEDGSSCWMSMVKGEMKTNCLGVKEKN